MHIPGTVLFTGEQSRRGYRLNRMAMTLTDPANRARFVADEAGYMRNLDLDDAEIELVRRRDWRGMLDHGGSIYLLLKIAAALGHSLQEVGLHTSRPAEGA
jgi:protocatechuate 4,5-dioxygenase alpha subunit